MGRLFGRPEPRTAAEWFAVRRQSLSPSLERKFDRWLAADRANAEDYALCEILWEISGPAASALAAPARARRAWVIRWVGVPLVAAAATAVGLLMWVSPRGQVFETGPGEQRTLVLADGSRVTLNTRSRLAVTLGRGTRTAKLDEGEAFFDVAKDPERPFIVATRLGSARAVGTHFDVLIAGERLAVTTQEGTVLVSGMAADGGVPVTAGRRASLAPGMARASVVAADVERAVSWLRQRIEVSNEPLSTVLEEFSRYTTLPVRCEGAEIGALRVSAVLRTGDLDALAATLHGAFGLDLERRADSFVIVRRGTAPVPIAGP